MEISVLRSTQVHTHIPYVYSIDIFCQIKLHNSIFKFICKTQNNIAASTSLTFSANAAVLLFKLTLLSFSRNVILFTISVLHLSLLELLMQFPHPLVNNYGIELPSDNDETNIKVDIEDFLLFDDPKLVANFRYF